MTRKKFLILDGNSLIHRAFHALPLLKTISGQATNAVYGFTIMLMKLLDEFKPDYMAIAFDRAEPTFRHIEYSEYKAHRDKAPEELLEQFPVIRSVIQHFGIEQLDLKGFEADDIIGTLSLKAKELDTDTFIVTSDRDLLQLVDDNIYVLLVKRGISEMMTYDTQRMLEEFQIPPKKFPDLKGLMGDASDNIPGVPGIGKKTAMELLNQYGSMENLFDHVDYIPQKRIRSLLKSNKNLAMLSKELSTIVRNAPITVKVSDCLVQKPDTKHLIQLFTQLQFETLINKLQSLTGESFENTLDASKKGEVSESISFEFIDTKEALVKLKSEIEHEEVLGIKIVGTDPLPMKTKVLGIGICTNTAKAFYVCADERQGELSPVHVFESLKDILESETPHKICFDVKDDAVIMKRFDVTLGLAFFDVMIASYLLNSTESKHDLERCILTYTDKSCAWNEKFGSKKTSYADKELEGMDGKDIGQLVCRDLSLILSAYNRMEVEIKGLNMNKLLYDIELPLAKVLAEMEYVGVKVSPDILRIISLDLEKQLNGLTYDIYSIAEEEFNINSPKQLGEILFEKLKLPSGKKTKTGYSTDAAVLESLRPYSPIIDKILAYRQLTKLKNTYADSLGMLINSNTGRIHTTFNQTVTATGRLSSTEPNLQNIPIRTEEGKRIREAFIPQEGYVFLSADYSQIELRVLAHISGDENLCNAFIHDEDIHLRTASEISGIPLNMITPELRSRAKTVNFGIVYGISPFGLSRDLGIGVKEAEKYIEMYFRRYSGVKKYIDNTIREAKEKGYVTTLFNRRRYLPELQSRNNAVRMFGERSAINTPIQGTAADIIKLAMIKVYDGILKTKVNARLILQVHDELLVEVAESDLKATADILMYEMEHAVTLNVPLKVDIKTGYDWANMMALNK